MATDGEGRPARLAASVVCRQARGAARLLCRARDERVVRLAEATLVEIWESSDDGPKTVFYSLLEASGAEPSPAVIRLLLAPAADGTARVVAALDGCGRFAAGPHLLRWAAEPAIGDLLRVTDHPHLLESMEDAFVDGLHDGGAGLWSGNEPTPLLRAMLDNPQLDESPRWAGAWPAGAESDLAVLAMLKGRRDLLELYRPEWLVGSLLVTAGSRLPAVVIEGCRRVLRELPAGPARERLCEWAMDGSAEARAAVSEAGFVPADPKRLALFLFCSQQWERYDELDPHGAKLRKHKRSYSDADWERLSRAGFGNRRRVPRQPVPPQAWIPRAAVRVAEVTTTRYHPGGTAVSGSGGFGNPGGISF